MRALHYHPACPARLTQPLSDDALMAYQVARAVSSNRAEGPALIEPLEGANKVDPLDRARQSRASAVLDLPG